MNASRADSRDPHAHLMKYGVPDKGAICTTAQVALPAVLGLSLTTIGITCVAWGGASTGALTVAGLATGGTGLGALAVAAVVFRCLHTTVQAQAQAKAQRQASVEWKPEDLPPIGSVMPTHFELVCVLFTTREEVYDWLAFDDAQDSDFARVFKESDVQQYFQQLLEERNQEIFDAFTQKVLEEQVWSIGSLFVACRHLFEQLAEGRIDHLKYGRPFSESQTALKEMWEAVDRLIMRKLEFLKPLVPKISSSEFLSYYASRVPQKSSSCEQLVVQDEEDKIVSAVAIDISCHSQEEQEPIWDFPLLEEMLWWIETERLQKNGSWYPESSLYSVFYASQNTPQPSDLLQDLLSGLANMKRGLRHQHLQLLLDASVWVAAKGDAEKAYMLKLALMSFFADHHCLRDPKQSVPPLVSLDLQGQGKKETAV